MPINLGNIFLVLLEGPKVGLLPRNHGKTALIYSVVTINLGFRPTRSTKFALKWQVFYAVIYAVVLRGYAILF